MSFEKFDSIPYEPDYNLTEVQIALLEADLGTRLSQEMGLKEDLYSLWVNPNSIYANIARTNERKYWKYMPEIMSEHEDQSLFLMIYDTRAGRNEVVHGTRISGFTPDGLKEENEKTGLIIIDDIINSDQGLTAKNFRDYYTSRGIDLMKCITVESNVSIAKTKRYNGLHTPDLAYLSIFKNLVSRGGNPGDSYVFAVINMPTVLSFGRIGLDYESLAGMKNLRTPSTPGHFDDDFIPVAMPHTDESHKIFQDIEEFALKEVYFA